MKALLAPDPVPAIRTDFREWLALAQFAAEPWQIPASS